MYSFVLLCVYGVKVIDEYVYFCIVMVYFVILKVSFLLSFVFSKKLIFMKRFLRIILFLLI